MELNVKLFLRFQTANDLLYEILSRIILKLFKRIFIIKINFFLLLFLISNF